MSQAQEALGTPKFVRVEIRMSGKTGLRRAADQLRELAAKIEAIGQGELDDATADFVAWANIKAASQKLRAGQ